MGNGVGKAIVNSMAWIAEGTPSSRTSNTGKMRDVRIFKPLGLGEKQVKIFKKNFKMWDIDHVGKVEAANIMKAISFIRPYGLRLFCPLVGGDEDEDDESSSDDEDEDSKPTTKKLICSSANFLLFVSSIWFYCTCDTEDLVNMAYIQYDLDNNKVLTMSELNMLIEELYTEQVTHNPHVARILANLRKVAEREDKLRMERQIMRIKTRMQRAQNNKKGLKAGLSETHDPTDDDEKSLSVAITPQVFRKFLAKHKMLVKPLQELQFKLRVKLCGDSFWEGDAKNARANLLKKNCGCPKNIASMDRLEALRSFLTRFQTDMFTAGKVYVKVDEDEDEEEESHSAPASAASAPAAAKQTPTGKPKKGTFITINSDDDSTDDDSDNPDGGRMRGARRKKNVKIGVGGSVVS